MAECTAVISSWGFAHIATHNDVGFTGSVLHKDPQGFEDVIAPLSSIPPELHQSTLPTNYPRTGPLRHSKQW